MFGMHFGAPCQPVRSRPVRLRRACLRGLLCALWLLLSVAAFAQVSPRAPDVSDLAGGQLPMQSFTPAEYGAAAQNWCLAQGLDGVIYAGNVGGSILVYDGTGWRHITVPDEMVVRSLAVGPDGRVYVGLVGDFGVLAPDGFGRLAYHSLLDKVPESERGFSDVWRIHVTDQGIYFSTVQALYRLHDDTVSVIRPEQGLHLSFLVNGALFVRVPGKGLMRVSGNQLQPVPGGAYFADKRIYALLPWSDAQGHPAGMLAATRDHGWYVLHDGAVRVWHTDMDGAWAQAAIYGAQWLDSGQLAVATLREGLFVLDREGHRLRHVTRDSGLTSNVVLAMLQDRQHGLWLATGNGLVRVDMNSPLTSLGPRSGLRGAVLAMVRLNGHLYAGTTEGLFRRLVDSDGRIHFEQIKASPGQNWDLLRHGQQLLVAGNEGVFVIDAGARVHALVPREGASGQAAQALLGSRRNPSRVFVAYQKGLGSLRKVDGHWINEGRIRQFDKQARSLAEDARGQLWLGLWGGGVERLTLPGDWAGPSDPRPIEQVTYGDGAGLPKGQISLAMVNGQVVFLTRLGAYRFDPQQGRFERDPQFLSLLTDSSRREEALWQTPDGALWLFTTTGKGRNKRTGVAANVDGHWQWLPSSLQALNGVDVFSLHADPDGGVWLGSEQRLYHYRPAVHPLPMPPLKAYIRLMAEQNGRAFFPQHMQDPQPGIPYQRNSIRFQFAAPSYGRTGASQFQIRLLGMSTDWSPWSSASYRDYTNLHEGTYIFEVRARNAQGVQSDVAQLRFVILPPWYRTAWAWALWMFLALLLMTLVVWLASLALRRRNRVLAEMIDQRTRELARANQALESSNQALAEQIVTDPLTGMRNRRYFTEHIEQDMAAVWRRQGDGQRSRQEAAREGYLLFLMVDIDHFKRVNDQHGHAAGDRVLKQFARILSEAVREMDMVVRMGGEEFLVVGRFVDGEDGPHMAERIRTAVEDHAFDIGEDKALHITCSVGFASCPLFHEPGEPLGWERILDLADSCMYAAKQHGRNAWCGLLPMARAPEGKLEEILHCALEGWPRVGALRVQASWAEPGDAPPLAGS